MKLFASLLSSAFITLVLGEDFQIELRGEAGSCFSSIDGKKSQCGNSDTVFTGSITGSSNICSKDDPSMCFSRHGVISKHDGKSPLPLFDLAEGVLKNLNFCIASDGDKLLKMRKNSCTTNLMPTELDIDGYLKIGDKCINPTKRKTEIGACSDKSSWHIENDKIKHNINGKCLSMKGRTKIYSTSCSSATTWTMGAFFKTNNKCVESTGRSIRVNPRGPCYGWLKFTKIEEPTTTPAIVSNVSQGKIRDESGPLPVRWEVNTTIILLGIGNKENVRNIFHVNRTTGKLSDNLQQTHMYPKVSFKENTDYDVVIETSDCNTIRSKSFHTTGWATGETHTIKITTQHVRNTRYPYNDDVFMKIYLDGNYSRSLFHRSCQMNWENKIIYTSNPWDEAANVHISAFEYKENGLQPNVIPGKIVKSPNMIKQFYKLRFTVKILARSKKEIASLIFVGGKMDRFPAIFWKPNTRFTMIASTVRSNKYWNKAELTDAAWVNNYTFEFEYNCYRGKGGISTRVPGGEWIKKKNFNCTVGYTTGKKVDIMASGGWHAPADVQLSNITWENYGFN